MLSGHTLHTPRVTVVVPVSSHTSHTSQVTVGVPGSRQSRKQNKNKQNKKYKKTKTNYRSHVKTNNLADSLPVANKLSVSRIPLSKELNSPVSLPVANKKTEDRHPDDKWVMDALIKTTKCQPAVRYIPGHTLHTPRVTVVVPVSGHMLSGHTLHTPRVTVVVPVSSHSLQTSQVTVGVPGSRRSRKQNKNKLNEKYKNQKSNYLSSVSLVDSVKLTKWFSQGQGHLVIPHLLRESLWRSLSALVTASILRESLHKLLQVNISKLFNHGHDYLVIPHILRESLCRSLSALVTPYILRESLCRSLSVWVMASILRESLHTQHNQSQISITPNQGLGYLVIPHILHESLCRSLSALVTASCKQVSVTHSISRKQRNKIIKQKNGNGKKSLSICHWNLGSKKWKNKRNQIQALVDSNNCDLIFISEANLDELTPAHESLITGYEITLPKTVIRNGTARLVLLTRDNLNFELTENLMDDTFSSIWVKISRQGMKSIMVCGVYREHQYLSQDNDWSLHPTEQTKRWTNFLRQVENARISSTCHLIGDFNLDYKKWTTPDYSQMQMITDTKNILEGGGFVQMVKDITRSWPGQVDSLIDHFWSNDPQKIIGVTNSVRAVGDHNVITAVIRIKGSTTSKFDTRKGSYKNFDPVKYRQRLDLENWSEIYEIEDVDLANNFLESRVVDILDSICPYKTVQHRADCKSWLTENTKNLMKTRDMTRERARISGDPQVWTQYKSLRNEVNRCVNTDRKTHYDKLYKRHHDNKDVGATYRTAKNQTGIKQNSSPMNLLHEGRKVTNLQEIADLMLKHFFGQNRTTQKRIATPCR